MRLFFAAPLEDDARARVAEIIRALAETEADYKWVEPENLHLTLAFLGETPESRLPGLKEALESAARGKPPFTLVFDRLGAFDSLEHPRVLWLGAGTGARELAALAAPLIPPEEERPFQAHLTLGRQRGAKNLSRLRQALKGLGAVNVATRVDRVELLRSRLSAAGPSYETLSSRPLK